MPYGYKAPTIAWQYTWEWLGTMRNPPMPSRVSRDCRGLQWTPYLLPPYSAPPPAQAVPDADFPAESLVDFIAAQMKPEFDWKVLTCSLTHFLPLLIH